jgi:hypothetical protein
MVFDVGGSGSSEETSMKRAWRTTPVTAGVVVWTLLVLSAVLARSAVAADAVEQWGIHEITLKGPADGNPFVDVQFSATFTCQDRKFEAAGFYDGDGTYRVRCMPDRQGEWRYETRSNKPELNGKAGTFTCGKPTTANNHGPVRVRNTFHFEYADGTPHYSVGTTSYAWIHQGTELEEQTLKTLKAAPFNKMRMCVFPKWYSRNHTEPQLYPFEGTAPDKWDFTKFNPKFFQHLEQRVGDLRNLGIEADLILFHPYDEGHWGFDRMPSDADDRYLHYVVARLAAYRNVWWSMANEWDFMKEKKETDFDRYFQIVARDDPYAHLRSVHNGRVIYDQNKPWVTHASIQNGAAVADFGRALLYRDAYRKPVVFDEVKYEGDIEQRWGNLSAEEMVHRFWQGTIAGTYVGHSETYKHPQDILWWSKGGVLHGQSPPRIAFLRKVLESGPRDGLDPVDKWQDDHTAGKAGEYYLIYFGKEKPTEWTFELPKAELTKDMKFRVEILDTWDMTVTPVDGEFTIRIVDGAYRMPGDGPGPIKLPGKQYMALRIRRAG